MVLAATRTLVEVHEATIRGLQEVDVLIGEVTPRGIRRALVRERDTLRMARSLVVALQAIVAHDQRLECGPALTEPPKVADLGPAGTVQISTRHLMAIRGWSLREQRRLRGVTGPAAVRLVDLLRRGGDTKRAGLVATVWAQGDGDDGGALALT